MKPLLPIRIFATVTVALALLVNLSACGKKSAADKLQEALAQTKAELPMTLDEDIAWVDARYDRSANEIVFEYTARENNTFTPEQQEVAHEMMVGQILPSFEADGPEMMAIIRKLRPSVRYIYRWTGDGHAILDDTCTADEYMPEP